MTAARADVAVVGGGLTGIATAYYLAEAGVAVALVERSAELCGASTARTAGLLLTGVADHLNRVAEGVGRAEAAAIWRFTLENAELVRGLVDRLGISCGYDPCGSWTLAASPAEAKDLADSVEILREERIDCGATLVGGAALAGAKGAPAGLAAIRYPRDAAIDPVAFGRGLAAAFPAGRVEVRTGAPVTSIDVSGEGVALDTPRGEVRAEIAVIAANAYAPEIHRFLRPLVWPVRGQGFITAPLPPVLASGVAANWGHEMYRQLPDGRLLAAGFRPGTTEDEIGYDESPTDTFQGFLEGFARERIPALPADLRIERRFAGLCGFAHDGLPIVGPLPGNPKVVVAGAYTMRGLSFAVAVGRAVAGLATEGERGELPQSFGPGRFLE